MNTFYERQQKANLIGKQVILTSPIGNLPTNTRIEILSLFGQGVKFLVYTNDGPEVRTSPNFPSFRREVI